VPEYRFLLAGRLVKVLQPALRTFELLGTGKPAHDSRVPGPVSVFEIRTRGWIARGRKLAIQETAKKLPDKNNPCVHLPLAEVTGCFSATTVKCNVCWESDSAIELFFDGRSRIRNDLMSKMLPDR
jgi:hypothetical protein